MGKNRNPVRRKKTIRLMAIWVATAVLGTILFLSGTFSSADRLALDRKFLLFQRDYQGNDITLITIDASSLDRFSRESNLQWPWPRELYGIIVDFLDQAGAKSITFDVLFDRPDIDRVDAEGPVSDRRFAEAVYNSDKVTLAANSVILESPDYRIPPEFQDFADHLVAAGGSHPQIPEIAPANLPIPALRYAGRQVANAYIPTRDDGVIRTTYLLMPVPNDDDQSRFFPSLPFGTWINNEAESFPSPLHLNKNYLHAGDLRIPLQKDGTYRINWYSRGGVNDGTFPYYSFYQVFRSAWSYRQGQPDRAPLDSGLFEGQHIVIGASAAGLSDIKTTPFSAIEPYPGMEIQATVLANLLDGAFLKEISDATVIVLIWILLLPVIFGIGSLRHINSILLTIGIPVLIILAGFSAFGLFRLVLPTVFLTGISIVGIGSTYIFRYLTEERQKKIMKSAFSQYIQKEFVDRIAEDPEQLKLGGQQKELTVMFTDMANFTSLSETLTPEELSKFLNDYLTDMTRIVFEYGGTLDKFIGDAVMAFWGAPIDQHDHALRACHCAIAMQQRLDERAVEWENAGYPPVHIRIGINTGPMVVGNMGSKDRFNYTVLGDAVNLGARLEPLNKQYETSVIISEFTLESVKKTLNSSNGSDSSSADKFKTRMLDRITVKGKTRPVTIYELQDI